MGGGAKASLMDAPLLAPLRRGEAEGARPMSPTPVRGLPEGGVEEEEPLEEEGRHPRDVGGGVGHGREAEVALIGARGGCGTLERAGVAHGEPASRCVLDEARRRRLRACGAAGAGRSGGASAT
jgi:hypothetical protein